MDEKQVAARVLSRIGVKAKRAAAQLEQAQQPQPETQGEGRADARG